MASVDVPVALLGYGTAGSAVDRLLRDQAADIERATGHRLRVVRALVRDPASEPYERRRFHDNRFEPCGLHSKQRGKPGSFLHGNHPQPPAGVLFFLIEAYAEIHDFELQKSALACENHLYMGLACVPGNISQRLLGDAENGCCRFFGPAFRKLVRAVGGYHAFPLAKLLHHRPKRG